MKSGTKFTPGPWIIQERSDPYERVTTRQRVKNRKVEIATMRTDYTGAIGAEQQANLALILSAPELHNAVQALSENIEKARDLWEDGKRDEADEWIAVALTIARAALAKAAAA